MLKTIIANNSPQAEFCSEPSTEKTKIINEGGKEYLKMTYQGYDIFMYNNVIHRELGPAIIPIDGFANSNFVFDIGWYWNGEKIPDVYSLEEFQKKIKTLILK